MTTTVDVACPTSVTFTGRWRLNRDKRRDLSPSAVLDKGPRDRYHPQKGRPLRAPGNRRFPATGGNRLTCVGATSRRVIQQRVVARPGRRDRGGQSCSACGTSIATPGPGLGLRSRRRGCGGSGPVWLRCSYSPVTAKNVRTPHARRRRPCRCRIGRCTPGDSGVRWWIPIETALADGLRGVDRAVADR